MSWPSLVLLVALLAFAVFVLTRLLRSWFEAGRRWGGHGPDDLDAGGMDDRREDREGR
jgi:hypothetical protein